MTLQKQSVLWFSQGAESEMRWGWGLSFLTQFAPSLTASYMLFFLPNQTSPDHPLGFAALCSVWRMNCGLFVFCLMVLMAVERYTSSTTSEGVSSIFALALWPPNSRRALSRQILYARPSRFIENVCPVTFSGQRAAAIAPSPPYP